VLKVTKGTHILVIWVVTSCLVGGYGRFGGNIYQHIYCTGLYPESGGTAFLWNVVASTQTSWCHIPDDHDM